MTDYTSEEKKHGRDAESPAHIPARGWRDILLRITEQTGNNHLSITAAGIAYFALLALFPALAALVSLYGLFFDPAAAGKQLVSIRSIVPPEAYAIISHQLRAIVSQPRGNLSFGFVAGIVLTVYSANKGVMALIDAMNIVYEERERRGFIKLNLFSLFYTFTLIVSLAVSLAIIVVAPAVLAFLPVPGLVQILVTYLPWPFLAVLVILLLNFTYCYFPSRRRAKWRWLTAGSVLASIVWIAASALFSFYVRNFGNFNKTYGSVGAVVVLMMWFYISAYIVLLGGTLNAEMEHQTAVDSTIGKPKPRGERGAHMADDLGKEKRSAKGDRS